MHRKKTPYLIGLVLGTAVSPAAASAAEDKEAPDAFAKFSECAAIQSDNQRLACYDGLVDAMQTASKKVDDLELTVAKTNAFGAENFVEDDDELKEIEQAAKLTSPVAKIQLLADRRLKITLENGQVWRQLPNDRIIPTPEEGVEHTAVVRKAMFGRYTLRIEPGGRQIRVKREE